MATGSCPVLQPRLPGTHCPPPCSSCCFSSASAPLESRCRPSADVSALAEPLRSPHPRLGTASVEHLSAETGLTVGVAGVLTATAFAADGGLRLEPTTWTEIGLLLVGAGLTAAAVLRRGFSGRLYGGLPLLWLGLLAALTALSITWSLSPADSWDETNRTLTYVASMAGAIALVRLVPGR